MVTSHFNFKHLTQKQVCVCFFAVRRGHCLSRRRDCICERDTRRRQRPSGRRALRHCRRAARHAVEQVTSGQPRPANQSLVLPLDPTCSERGRKTPANQSLASFVLGDLVQTAPRFRLAEWRSARLTPTLWTRATTSRPNLRTSTSWFQVSVVSVLLYLCVVQGLLKRFPWRPLGHRSEYSPAGPVKC